MSHIVQVQTEVRDAEAVRAACRRLGLEEPAEGTARLFEGEVSGLLVKLPEWVYPAVVDTATGQVKYDNYEGQWGDQKHLGAFLQAYAIEKAKLEARKRGHSVFRAAHARRVRQADDQRRRWLVSNKIIEIVVGPKGETTVQTKGFSGPECQDASRFIENALGKRTAEQLTAEFYQQGQQTNQDLGNRSNHVRAVGSPRPSPSHTNRVFGVSS